MTNGSRIVAEKYAAALFRSAEAAGDRESARTDAGALAAVLKDRTVSRFFKDPSVSLRLKEQAALSLSEEGALTRRASALLTILLREGRLNVVQNIADMVDALCAKADGVKRVEAVFALQPEQATVKRLTDLLEEQWGGKVELACSTDKHVLGGFKILLGAKQYDFTLQTRLKRLSEFCASEAS